jgi:hypothetical protein
MAYLKHLEDHPRHIIAVCRTVYGTSKTFCVVGSRAREPLSRPVISNSLYGG